MKQLAADMEFEQAAEVRDLIESIKHIASKQRVDNTTTDDRDVIAMATNNMNEGVISVFFHPKRQDDRQRTFSYDRCAVGILWRYYGCIFKTVLRFYSISP